MLTAPIAVVEAEKTEIQILAHCSGRIEHLAAMGARLAHGGPISRRV
ncbi:hypothetical protein [Paracoccus ravus]|nr:hypothetical protein [Paracoccus ravus]